MSARDLAYKIAKACRFDGELEPQTIFRGLEDGTYRQWLRNQSVIVTSLIERPEGFACRIVLVAGDIDDVWSLHDEEIVPWAREEGRSFMIGDGRMGWKASAEAHGYVSHGWRLNKAGNDILTLVKDL